MIPDCYRTDGFPDLTPEQRAKVRKERDLEILTEGLQHVCQGCPNSLDDCFPETKTRCWMKAGVLEREKRK